MRRISSADLLEMKWVSEPQISPDGSAVLFTVRRVVEEGGAQKYKTNIYLAADGCVRPFTSGSGDDRSPRWSPDGKQIAFLSQREAGPPQIYILDRDGGEAMPLTSRKEGVGEPIWSPDGSTIAFSARETSSGDDGESKDKSDVRVISKIRYKMNGRGLITPSTSHVHLLDVKTRKITQLTHGTYDCRDPIWSPSGESIAFISAQYEGHELSSIRDIYVVSRDGGTPRRITNQDAVLGGISWSPDGSTLAFYGHDNSHRGATVSELGIIPAEGGEIRFLTKECELAVAGSAGGDMGGSPGAKPAWSRDSGRIYVSALSWGRTHLYKVDSFTGEREQITSGDASVLGWSKAQDSDQVALHVGSPTLIGDMFLLDTEPRSPIWEWAAEDGGPEPFALGAPGCRVLRLTHVNEELLSQVELSEPREFRIAADDGTEIQGWLMRPIGMKEGEKYPLAVEIHGGPHSAYGFVFVHEFQLLAARGYGVVFSNPRGSVGCGQDFLSAIRHDWGGVDYRDIMGVTDHATREPWVDGERLGVLGGSYGGYMTNWIVTQTNRFRAAVTMRSTCNRMSQFGASDAAFTNGQYEFDGDPWDNPKAYLDVSPLMYVRNVETPIMIIHSEQDLRCPMEQAEEWFIALKKTGKTVVFVRFPDENHELSRSGKPKHRITRLEFICAWFDRYLLPVPEHYVGGLPSPSQPVAKLLPDA